MSAYIQSRHSSVRFDHKHATVKRDMADLYTDYYKHFGWILEKSRPSFSPDSVVLIFKRSIILANKVELTRLQREFESHANQIAKLEMSKEITASIAAYIIGVVGVILVSGALLAAISGLVPLSTINIIIGAIGLIIPYFCFRYISKKKTVKVAPLIEDQYEAIHKTCERAAALLHQ